ncbi:MAG: hypothetical protein K1000chlam2_01229 [Chlamydiae bacterium]|nr:hypothetical protein [Chlamydiota bacterium]
MQVTLPVADVLCVYGFPEGELLEELKHWLNEEDARFVVVIEDDEKALMRGSEHERIRLCNGENEEALKQIAWEFVFLTFEYWKVPGNGAKNLEKMEALFAKMAFLQEGIHLVASDFQHRGIDLLTNFLRNSSCFSNASDGRDLFGAFKGVPAVICGAGASLEMEAPYLRTLKDRALIFAGGTALSSLSQFSIQPHFGALIDPHPPSKRYFENGAHAMPLFFQNRVHPTVLEQAQGPLLWIPGSRNDFLEKEMFDGGWNVSTFQAALACHLGCNPIILVGVDLAQSKDKHYAGDFERPEEGELVPIEGGLFTRRDWIFAADWLSHFAKLHPEVEWINASCGMEIAGFEKKPLHEVSFERQLDLQGEVYSAVLNLEKGMQRENFGQSFEKVGELCEKMLALLEQIYPNPVEKNGEYALLELEIEKEMAYVRFLRPIWDVWKHVFARQIPKEIPKVYGMGLNQWLFMKGICDDARKI